MESQSKPALVQTELFALYGAQAQISRDWRVELNPKATRDKGDVVFQSPGGNRFFLSWGPLNEATKQFKELDQHRDKSIERVKKGQDVKSLEIIEKKETEVFHHRALFSHISAVVRQGVTGRSVAKRRILSVHFYCPESGRYYVVFGEERKEGEFDNLTGIFESFYKSVVCH